MGDEDGNGGRIWRVLDGGWMMGGGGWLIVDDGCGMGDGGSWMG